MKVAVVGSTGTIGRAVVDRLSARHDVIKVGHKSGDHQVDISSPDSIKRFYESIGQVDAVVSTAGVAQFGPFEQLTDDDFALSVHNKMMGQVNLVRIGYRYLIDGGSFTVTSGVLGQEPVKGSTAISLVNAALDGFVRAAALELPRGMRVNAVSPGWVKETLIALGMDSTNGTPAEQVALAYAESLEGQRSGEVIDARKFAKR